jgi:putative ABC transport system substrate-binding protein
MRLRTIALISTLVLGLIAAPLPAEAQKAAKVYRIGYLSSRWAEQQKGLLAAFRQGLEELGYVTGKNIVIEQRYAERKRDRVPALAAELVRLQVDIIVTHGGSTIRAAKKASATTPIVMTYQADPVGTGLVASLARPGGTITGLSDYHGDMFPKRLELLKEVVPSVSRVAILINPRSATTRIILKDIQAAAPAFGVTILPLEIKSPEDIPRAFTMMKKERVGGFLQSVAIGGGGGRRRIADLAAKSQIPAVYTRGRWVSVGGLMSYGSNLRDLYHRAATYVDKILKGAKPADLPIEQPTKFDLVINLKTAKQIGVTIPPEMLFRADKVIK